MFFQYKITENRGNEVIILELADKVARLIWSVFKQYALCTKRHFQKVYDQVGVFLVTVLSGSIDLLEVLLNEARLQESFDE